MAKVEGQDGKIIGKRCPVFDYTEKKIVTISAYKQELTHELERVKKLTSSSLPWVEKIKTEKIWLYESEGKLKGIGNQGEVKMHEINVHTITNSKGTFKVMGFPKPRIDSLGNP